MQDAMIRTIARELKHAQDDNVQIDPVTSRFKDFSVEKAYQVAGLIHAQRIEKGWVPVGRKIGFTHSAMWPVYGVNEPIWSYMYDRTVTYMTGTEARCLTGCYSEPRIEPEIVVHFSATPPAGLSPSELLAYIDWIAPGFEIVQSHFADWKFQAADTIADRGLHAELLIGEQMPVHQAGTDLIQALESFQVVLSCNKQPLETGYGSNVLGSPLLAVLHLLSVLSRQSDAMPVQAGEIVTTGTLTSAFRIEAGQCWDAAISGIALSDLILHVDQ